MAGEDKFEPHDLGPAPVLEELAARLERIEARLDEMEEDAASGGDSQEPAFENNDLVVQQGESCSSVKTAASPDCQAMETTVHSTDDAGTGTSSAGDEWDSGWVDSGDGELRLNNADAFGSTASANLYGSTAGGSSCNGIKKMEDFFFGRGTDEVDSHYNRDAPGDFTGGASLMVVTNLMCVPGTEVGSGASATINWAAAGSDFTVSSITVNNTSSAGYEAGFPPTAAVVGGSPSVSPGPLTVTVVSSTEISIALSAGGGTFPSGTYTSASVLITETTYNAVYKMALRELKFDSCGKLLGVSRMLLDADIVCSGTE